MSQSDEDERLAALLATLHQRISDQMRFEDEGALRALEEAFRQGRWGSYWCRFRDPITALRRLADLLAVVTPYISRTSQSEQLARRLVEVVVEMALVVVAGERAGLEKETHDLLGLIRLKDDFFRLAVHELRGPAGRLSGYLSLAEDGDLGSLPEPAAKALPQMGRDAALLLSLLDSLADLARMEDQAELLHRSTCNAGEIATAAIEASTAEAAAKKIHLESRIPNSTFTLNVDASYLKTAVTNVIGNAIKYSPEMSTVTIAMSKERQETCITVRDQGPGIAQEDIERLFDKYQRGNSATTGLWLGLYLVRRIAELHGGRVEVISSIGQGSAFAIFIPSIASEHNFD
jgi:signal transduction histidine kinase